MSTPAVNTTTFYPPYMHQCVTWQKERVLTRLTDEETGYSERGTKNAFLKFKVCLSHMRVCGRANNNNVL